MENQIFQLWQEVFPQDAYTQGIERYAGKMFIAEKENEKKALKKIAILKKKTRKIEQKKFLTMIEETIKFKEPQALITSIFWTYFYHMVKEGVVAKHMASLCNFAEKNLDIALKENKNKKFSMEIKILTYNECNALIGILETIKKETKDKKLIEKVNVVIEKTKNFRKYFEFEGLNKGDFENCYPLLKNSIGFKRKNHKKLLKNLYDYPESSEEIREKALKWIENELPKVRQLAKELSIAYNCENNIEVVDKKLSERTKIKKEELMNFISAIREKSMPIVKKKLVKITPKYRVKMIETPDYLKNIIPTAAMSALNTLTKKPFTIFFITIGDEMSAVDILQMLVHEEYGHCVNFLNVSDNKNVALLEKISSSLDRPITEGISFYREIEFLNLLKEMVKVPSKEEKEFLSLFGKYNLQLFMKEFEFFTYKWRIIRFLRAVSDIEINNGRNIAEFIDWASQLTGFSKKTIYNQIFFFQEMPGYAPSYSIAGMSLGEIQKSKKDKVGFNSFACSSGFPPRSIWEERLRNW